MNGKLHIQERGHECHPPGSGWHGTWYYDENGVGQHLRPGDKWECDCGKWWVAGIGYYGHHKWYPMPGLGLYSRLKGLLFGKGKSC